MSNFDFLKEQGGYYDLFASACIEAEKVFASSPAMCAVGCRKALELAVKWVYAADDSIRMPYKDNLSSLLHEQTFKQAVDGRVWRCLIGINRLGNLSVHTETKVRPEEAILSLRGLFSFVDWIDYCYGPNYEQREFDERKIPPKGIPLTRAQVLAIKERESLLVQKNDEIEALQQKVAEMQAQLAAAKAENTRERTFEPEEIFEWETRKRYIDWDLALAGWSLGTDVIAEREVHGMPTASGALTGTGYIDYLLMGKDGKPLAILEAKRTAYSADKGEQQARLYASCLAAEFGYRPLIFLSNGFETFFIDGASPKRRVSGVFSRDDLRRILRRHQEGNSPSSVAINQEIAGGGAGRYYQAEAIRRVCANIEEGHRKSLIVMATGTGKTRVAVALTDVLMRAGQVKNVLFLADRVALVKQARNAYKYYLPSESLCNLCSNKEDWDARIVFSTYPTILNSIDSIRNEDGALMYTPAHFDLIIVDEAHRSIFKKYRVIFEHFDSLVVGLTATPADEVDRNTYDFFDVERGVPTYVYEYETAVNDDHVLVPYLGIECHTSFIDDGITYDKLSDEDREAIEEDFEDVGQEVPDYIDPGKINSWVFNEGTVDSVLETLMEKGIRVKGGETVGKSIIFAQNQKHAKFIVERFEKLYPNLPGGFIKCVLHSQDYVQTVIEEFENPDRSLPEIVVSVDMMDTGIDVPEVLNLVFFKKVRSKIKFWQMIGRGTRLRPGLEVLDPLDGPHEDKERFFIFDWCRNFEFFRMNPKTVEGKPATSLSEIVFSRQAQLAKALQVSEFTESDYQAWRSELVHAMCDQVSALNEELVSVRQKRRAVEKFRQPAAYVALSDADLAMLKADVSPLVHNEESDISALRFDVLMYGYMCALLEGQSPKVYRSKLVSIAVALQQVTTIPQVKEKLPLIQSVTDEHFFDGEDLLELERIRIELRGLVRFIAEGAGCGDVRLHLEDPLTKMVFGVEADIDETYEDYKLKVEHYLKAYSNTLVIHKLRHNKPMTEEEFRELGNIFTKELGCAEDYEKAYGDTPFGLLVRKIVHLDREAAMEAFADFISAPDVTAEQVNFVHKIVDYVVENGSIEPEALIRPPFDRPRPFIRLFNGAQQSKLLSIIKGIKDNAERPAA